MVPVLLAEGLWSFAVGLAWAWGVLVLVRSDVRSAADGSGLRLSREFPRKVSVGVENVEVLTITNLTDRTVRLSGRDTPPPAFEGDFSFGPLRLAPLSEHRVEVSFVPAERGTHAYGIAGAVSMGRRGLAGRRLALGTEERVKVYPDLTPVRSYDLQMRRGTMWDLGVRRMRRAGRGTEFESLREYRSGDEYRDIDWKATARHGSPVTRTFEAERSQVVVLAVDAGRLMTSVSEGRSKLDRAVDAALLLAYVAVQADDRVGLLLFRRDVVRYVPPSKGRQTFSAILEELHAVEGAVEEPDYAGAMRFVVSRLSKRALIVLFTDLAGTEPSRRLLDVLAGLTPRHLPLVVTQRSGWVEDRAARVPDEEPAVFETAVAESILRDKAEALTFLRSHGVLAVDVAPSELSVAAVDRYARVKTRGEL